MLQPGPKHTEPPSPWVFGVLALGVKLTTHLYLALRLRISQAMHLLIHIPLYHTQGHLYFPSQYFRQFYCTEKDMTNNYITVSHKWIIMQWNAVKCYLKKYYSWRWLGGVKTCLVWQYKCFKWFYETQLIWKSFIRSLLLSYNTDDSAFK
jgi:hypothetical protein